MLYYGQVITKQTIHLEEMNDGPVLALKTIHWEAKNDGLVTNGENLSCHWILSCVSRSLHHVSKDWIASD